MSFFEELKRRNVLRVGAAYAVGAWLVIQIAETVFPVYDLSDAWIRAVITVLLIGLPPTLILAWVFEFTPEGIKREKDVDRSHPVDPRRARKLDRLIILGLVLAVGYFAFDKFVLSESRMASIAEKARLEGRAQALLQGYSEKSIAVLPFVNLTGNQEDEYFSDGIAEEVLALLGSNPRLRVISRSSAFAFKGQQLPITEIAERLNVSHVLEGSVRRSGERVRIAVKLIEAHSDAHLWSKTFERSFEDIFAIQNEIAVAVANALEVKLLGSARESGTVNPEAYGLYLQGRHLARLMNPTALSEANALYRQALANQPDYPAALVGLAKNYTNQANFGVRPLGESLEKARELSRNALSIDGHYAPAHASLGWIAMSEGELAVAAKHLQRALALDPMDVEVLRNCASLLQYLGRLDESIAIMELVTARDPVNPSAHFNLGTQYQYARRWSEAVASMQTAVRLSPDHIGAHYIMGNVFLFQGDAEAALDAFSRENDEEWRIKGMTMALHSLGRHEEFEAGLAELIERWGEQWPSEVAQVYAWAVNADETFEWLERAIEQQEEGLNEQFLRDYYKPVQDDPRWTAFLERTGSSPEQLAAIKFRIDLPGPN